MEWIELSKQKPVVYEDVGFINVIVFCKLWGVFLATYKRIDDTNYYEWFDSRAESTIPPTHWMLLPKPPKQ